MITDKSFLILVTQVFIYFPLNIVKFLQKSEKKKIFSTLFSDQVIMTKRLKITDYIFFSKIQSYFG